MLSNGFGVLLSGLRKLPLSNGIIAYISISVNVLFNYSGLDYWRFVGGGPATGHAFSKAI